LELISALSLCFFFSQLVNDITVRLATGKTMFMRGHVHRYEVHVTTVLRHSSALTLSGS